MTEPAKKIQAVINTLQGMEIRATYDNCNHLMGIYRILAEIRDELNSQDAQAAMADEIEEVK